MTLTEQLMNDFKEAMKRKDSLAVSVLSFLRAQVSYAALEKKKDTLDDAECVAVIKKLVKQHQDSITQFTAGARLDLVEKEEKEMAILKSYLPQEMPAEELRKLVDETVAELGASSMKDMGRVMKEMSAKTAGKADARAMSDAVKQRLSRSEAKPGDGPEKILP